MILSRALASLLLALSSACATMNPQCGAPATPEPESQQPASAVLFLIGDAGGAPERSRPVLGVLRTQILEASSKLGPERVAVVFLGDNIYSKGLPAENSRGRRKSEMRLDAQIDAVAGLGVATYFVPGNHDWNSGDTGGLAAIHRQEAYLDQQRTSRDGTSVRMLPRGGCPGPAHVAFTPDVDLLFLNTQFWLHPRKERAGPTCEVDSKEEVVDGIARALDTAGEKRVLILAHHPLRSGGPHGGYFNLRRHLFPLTEQHRALWIPVPLLGSLYVLARKAGLVSVQDLNSPKYRKLRSSMSFVMKHPRTLAWVAGHEHDLQILREESGALSITSGTGMMDHSNPMQPLSGSCFCSTAPGFLRLELPPGGAHRVGAVEVRRTGVAVRWPRCLD